METPESIELSLRKGGWITSLDFSDAYFHIPDKISQIPMPEPKFPLSGSSLLIIHRSNGIHFSGQGGQAYDSGKEYTDPPVPK